MNKERDYSDKLLLQSTTKPTTLKLAVYLDNFLYSFLQRISISLSALFDDRENRERVFVSSGCGERTIHRLLYCLVFPQGGLQLESATTREFRTRVCVLVLCVSVLL